MASFQPILFSRRRLTGPVAVSLLTLLLATSSLVPLAPAPARAEDAKVASKLIATMSDLERIAADDKADTPALSGWRREAFGEDALRLKRGELALVLDGARVRVVEVRRAPKG